MGTDGRNVGCGESFFVTRFVIKVSHEATARTSSLA